MVRFFGEDGKALEINANVGFSGARTRPNVRLDGCACPADVRLGGCDSSRQIPGNFPFSEQLEPRKVANRAESHLGISQKSARQGLAVPNAHFCARFDVFLHAVAHCAGGLRTEIRGQRLRVRGERMPRPAPPSATLNGFPAQEFLLALKGSSCRLRTSQPIVASTYSIFRCLHHISADLRFR